MHYMILSTHGFSQDLSASLISICVGSRILQTKVHCNKAKCSYHIASHFPIPHGPSKSLLVSRKRRKYSFKENYRRWHGAKPKPTYCDVNKVWSRTMGRRRGCGQNGPSFEYKQPPRILPRQLLTASTFEGVIIHLESAGTNTSPKNNWPIIPDLTWELDKDSTFLERSFNMSLPISV